MKMRATFRVISATVAIAILVTVSVVVHSRAFRKERIATNAVLVSSTGVRLSSFFDGLAPIKAYVNGKMYASKDAPGPGCRKKLNFVDRVAITLGLEQVAKAQTGCDQPGCNGCWEMMRSNPCSVCGDGTSTVTDSGGEYCFLGFQLDGPACAADDCECNKRTCSPSAAMCCGG
jgi:hypothetical protein